MQKSVDQFSLTHSHQTRKKQMRRKMNQKGWSTLILILLIMTHSNVFDSSFLSLNAQVKYMTFQNGKMSYSLVFLVSNIVEKLWIFDYRVNAHSSNIASTSFVAACFKSVMNLDVIVIEGNPDQEDHGSNEEDSFFCEHVVDLSVRCFFDFWISGEISDDLNWIEGISHIVEKLKNHISSSRILNEVQCDLLYWNFTESKSIFAFCCWSTQTQVDFESIIEIASILLVLSGSFVTSYQVWIASSSVRWSWEALLALLWLLIVLFSCCKRWKYEYIECKAQIVSFCGCFCVLLLKIPFIFTHLVWRKINPIKSTFFWAEQSFVFIMKSFLIVVKCSHVHFAIFAIIHEFSLTLCTVIWTH